MNKRRRFVLYDSDTDTESFDSGSQRRLEHHNAPDRWRDLAVRSLKFIDDLTGREKCDITDCMTTVSTRKEDRFLHACLLESFFENVTGAAVRMGMRVNPTKIQLLCTNTSINYDIHAQCFI